LFGLIGLLVFVADIWALLNILHSPAARSEKTLWVAMVLFPVLGVVLWYLLGPRRSPPDHPTRTA
jgi:hypothetical protein